MEDSLSLSLQTNMKPSSALSQAWRQPGPGVSTWDQVWFLFPSQELADPRSRGQLRPGLPQLLCPQKVRGQRGSARVHRLVRAGPGVRDPDTAGLS